MFTTITKYCEILKQNKNDLAQWISQEVGKPLWESLLEVTAIINKTAISFEAYDDRCQQSENDNTGIIQSTRFKPHGITAVLGPFNLPAHLPHGHIIPALLAGNTIIFKPSELTPLVGQKYLELWKETDLPKGVLNMVQGGKETGISLTAHKDIQGIFFTGSYETGSAIHKSLAGYP